MGMGYFRVEMAWKMCGIFPFSHNIPTISPLKKVGNGMEHVEG
jgi:hypothetical protein